MSFTLLLPYHSIHINHRFAAYLYLSNAGHWSQELSHTIESNVGFEGGQEKKGQKTKSIISKLIFFNIISENDFCNTTDKKEEELLFSSFDWKSLSI